MSKAPLTAPESAVPELIVLFDGVCNLCNASVQRIIRNDRRKRFYFASLQSPFGQQMLKKYGLDPTAADSLVFFCKGKPYQYSSAVLRICAYLDFPYPLLQIGWVVPPFLRNAVYRNIAKHRYRRYGRSESCMLPEPALKSRFLDDSLLTF